MKFSMQWLQKLVTIKSTPEQLAAKITDAGLEVESLENNIFELAIPPNRADCLGMVGIARDVAAIEETAFKEPNIAIVNETIGDKVAVNVLASDVCPKYLCRVIKNVNNTIQTPDYIKECLNLADIKLISAVVDITNYAMLLLGQPLHAFDLHKISGGVVVRHAVAGEELLLLDDTTVKLTPQALVIADSTKPHALGGIMGGKDSGISANTKDVLLECAYFEPVAIRLTARHFGIKTDASYRYERCIDPTMQEKSIDHATRLILDIVGGEAGPVTSFIDKDKLPKVATVTLRSQRITKILGITLTADKITSILQSLGMQVSTADNGVSFTVVVPAFRTDITREVDLIEELVRIYGFAKIPEKSTVSTLEFKPQPEAKLTEQQVGACLANRGYNEAITYSFIDPEYAKFFTANVNQDLCLVNPISSEMSLMRPSLLPGLIKALQYNQNRQQARIRLFEIGLRFIDNGINLQQIKTVAGVCYGPHLTENWHNDKRDVDFYDVKSDVIALFKLAHNDAELSFIAATDMAMHPGQCVEIVSSGNVVGKLGALHPQLQQTLALPGTAYMFELDYEFLIKGKIPNFKLFSKFPAVRRDIALLVDKITNSAKIEQVIKQQAGDLLTDLTLFDLYQGKGIPEGQKSMALGFTLQHPERTLTDLEVSDIFNKIVTALQHEFNATLR
jgi:phenylalanyl-tRNA synthetase beta chain